MYHVLQLYCEVSWIDKITEVLQTSPYTGPNLLRICCNPHGKDKRWKKHEMLDWSHTKHGISYCWGCCKVGFLQWLVACDGSHFAGATAFRVSEKCLESLITLQVYTSDPKAESSPLVLKGTLKSTCLLSRRCGVWSLSVNTWRCTGDWNCIWAVLFGKAQRKKTM